MENTFAKQIYFSYERYKAKYNKKEKVFCYNIDSIQNDLEKKVVVIKGWGFSTLDSQKLTYQLVSPKSKDTILVRKNREDVNDMFNISKKEKLGFEITIRNIKFKNVLNLILKNSQGITLAVKIDRRKLGKYKFSEFIVNSLKTLKNDGLNEVINRVKMQKNNVWNSYDFWIYNHEKYDLKQVRQNIDLFQLQPKISIVVPVYNVDEKWLRRNIESVRSQYYANWELCLADDCSPAPHIKKILNEYKDLDERIKVVFREKNGHISEATNSAIALATGDYIGFMDNDDELAPFALYEYVKLINNHNKADFIYCDEDMIDTTGRRFNPFFKSSWNFELLNGHNYITHFVVVKKELLNKVGLLDSEVNGSQDYDFVLRATEEAKGIYHVPKILYHWRTIEGSVAENPEAKNYAYFAGQKALENAMERRGLAGEVFIAPNYGTYRINYNYNLKPLISIVLVGDKNKQILTQQCLESILKMTVYKNYEIVAVNCENSDIILDKKIHWVYNNAERTMSELKNFGAKKSKGEYLVFLDSTMKIIQSEWLEELLNYGLKQNVGIVGNKILDLENKVYNAGMWLDEKGSLVHYTHRGCQKDNLGYYYRLVLPQYVFSVSEECLMISKEKFDECRGFSVDLLHPLADIDLCLKIRQKNLEVVWTPYSEICQAEKKNENILKENLDVFKSKWSQKEWEDPYTNPYLIMNKI
ncbi:MAG: glycosyltransferase [Bacilli bacterium]